MSEKKFNFISPGVFIEEIDKSRLPDEITARGPLVVGRATKGPSMISTRVDSFAEFVSTFGNPIPGGAGGDVWRNGNYTSPTYAAYAAQAYLRNNAPVNFVRLVGSKHTSAVDGGDGSSVDGTPGFDIGAYAGGGRIAGDNQGGGAQGLFIFNSGSGDSGAGGIRNAVMSGTLAAVWYFNNIRASAYLVGTTGNERNEVSGALGTLIKSEDLSFNVVVRSGSASGSILKQKTHFDFNPESDKFIRKVFNTNPTVTNTSQVATTNNNYSQFWLGETFEGVLKDNSDQQGVLTATGADYFGMILPLGNSTDGASGGSFKMEAVHAKTGWVFSQDFNNTGSYYDPATQARLFRLVARGAGDWYQKNIKISICDIAESNNGFNKFGSFTVEVRNVRDTDNGKIVLERFENLSLNPNSPKYIGRVIGDQYPSWNEERRRNIVVGTYANRSKYIRVELNTEVENGGAEQTSVPWGFEGPPQYIDWMFASGSGDIYTWPGDPTNAGDTAYLDKPDNKFVLHTDAKLEINPFGGYPDAFQEIPAEMSGACIWPRLKLRKSSDPATDPTLSDPRDAYFGLETRRSAGGRLFDESYLDLVGFKPKSVDGLDTGTYTSASFYFTMDDLSASADIKDSDPTLRMVYLSGSRDAATSFTAQGATVGSTTYAGSVKNLIRLGYNKFTMPMFGGFDGFDVTETEPLRNSNMTDGSSTRINSFIYNTYERAIDIVKDREIVDANLAVVPGLTLPTLTEKLITNCEERGDVLAIVDLENGYIPRYERTTSDLTETGNLGSVDTTVNTLRDRNLNSSYGCAYYPWVLIKDSATTGQTLWVPPSVVALGVMGNSETVGELWFAPAGFNRGGLTEGKSGLNVVGVRDRLTSKDRDDLYEQNVNPIASFPSEGVVIFGQKTLQTTRSALDRINVRRLLIFLKKEISFISSRVLFDQNVSATWARFLGQVDPLLSSVQSRFGLTDYKIVLDETTTTPELIDRNILYAKIFLKPARAIEYIALDFVITATGASFDE